MEFAWNLPELVDELQHADARTFATLRDGLTLRRVDSTGTLYSRSGKYEIGQATLPEFQALNLTEMIGFYAVHDGDGSVDFQLSPDGGTTWYYVTGGAWQVAGAGDWSTWQDIDAKIGDFPLTSEKRLLIRTRLQPTADGESRPALWCIALFYECPYDFWEDFHRSLKHYLEQEIRVERVSEFRVDGVDSISFDSPFLLYTPIKVFNLDTDPNRTTDLYASHSDRTVNFTSAQTGLIEVQFRAGYEVYISAEDVLEISTIPSIVMEFSPALEIRKWRSGHEKVEMLWSQEKARFRQPPVWMESSGLLVCQSPLKLESFQMAGTRGGCQTVLQQERVFKSEATGHNFEVVEFTPLTRGDRVVDGLYITQCATRIGGPAHLGDFVDKALAKELRFGVGDMARRLEEVEIP